MILLLQEFSRVEPEYLPAGVRHNGMSASGEIAQHLHNHGHDKFVEDTPQ